MVCSIFTRLLFTRRLCALALLVLLWALGSGIFITAPGWSFSRPRYPLSSSSTICMASLFPSTHFVTRPRSAPDSRKSVRSCVLPGASSLTPSISPLMFVSIETLSAMFFFLPLKLFFLFLASVGRSLSMSMPSVILTLPGIVWPGSPAEPGSRPAAFSNAASTSASTLWISSGVLALLILSAMLSPVGRNLSSTCATYSQYLLTLVWLTLWIDAT